jgi:hypothetical protein
VPKGKKIKVLTHRPRYIEIARVPQLAKGTSSTTEPGYTAPAISKGESTEMPKILVTESPEAPKHSAEAKGKAAEEPELGEPTGLPKILSLLAELELPKVFKAPAITPKRRRMASMLDAVLESTRASTPSPAKETAEATTIHAEIEAGPSVPIETGPAEARQSIEQELSDVAPVLEKELPKVEFPTPQASTKKLDFIIRHASGKKLSEEEIAKARYYARELKYSKGSLVYNGTDEDDFSTASQIIKKYLFAGR